MPAQTPVISIPCDDGCGAAIDERCVPVHPCVKRKNAATKITRDANRVLRDQIRARK